MHEWYNDTECDHFNPCLLVCSIPHARCGKAHIDDEGAMTATMLELFKCSSSRAMPAASVLIHN